MGIEPTCRAVYTRHNGFEDRGHHQVCKHFQMLLFRDYWMMWSFSLGRVDTRYPILTRKRHPPWLAASVSNTTRDLTWWRCPCHSLHHLRLPGKQFLPSPTHRSKQPRQISFTGTCQYVLASWMLLSCNAIAPQSLSEHCRCPLQQIAECEVANRPGRLEPGVLKRRRHCRVVTRFTYSPYGVLSGSLAENRTSRRKGIANHSVVP